MIQPKLTARWMHYPLAIASELSCSYVC